MCHCSDDSHLYRQTNEQVDVYGRRALLLCGCSAMVISLLMMSVPFLVGFDGMSRT